MTDLVNALVVVLDEDTQIGAVQPLIDAIRQMRGVIAVKEHVSGLDQCVADQRARSQIFKQIFDIAYPKEQK